MSIEGKGYRPNERFQENQNYAKKKCLRGIPLAKFFKKGPERLNKLWKIYLLKRLENILGIYYLPIRLLAYIICSCGEVVDEDATTFREGLQGFAENGDSDSAES